MRADYRRNASGHSMLNEIDYAVEGANPTARSIERAHTSSAPETRSSRRSNQRCRDAVREIPIALANLKRSTGGPRLPSMEVCGRRPPWRHRRPGGAGIRKPSHKLSSDCGRTPDIRAGPLRRLLLAWKLSADADLDIPDHSFTRWTRTIDWRFSHAAWRRLLAHTATGLMEPCCCHSHVSDAGSSVSVLRRSHRCYPEQKVSKNLCQLIGLS